MVGKRGRSQGRGEGDSLENSRGRRRGTEHRFHGPRAFPSLSLLSSLLLCKSNLYLLRPTPSILINSGLWACPLHSPHLLTVASSLKGTPKFPVLLSTV